MSASDSPTIIVARFLKANHYEKTLDAFLEESGLPLDAGTLTEDCLTIEKVLEEKRIFDLSLNYEKHGVEEATRWTIPAPSQPTVASLPEATNILSVSVQPFCLGSDIPILSLLVTTAGRRLSVLRANDSLDILGNLNPQDSPILSWTPILEGSISIGTSLSGQIILFNNITKDVLSERRDHTKYVIKAATYTDPASLITYVATAGWDAQIYLYTLPSSSSPESLSLTSPSASLSLPSNPEDILFHPSPTVENPSRLVLIVTRRDSTQLHFYTVSSFPSTPPSSKSSLPFLGTQNLAPHASAWSAFSCSSIARCPSDPSLLAVATSSLPSLKLILVRLLIPSEPPDPSDTPARAPIPTSTSSPVPGDASAAEAARNALAEQERFAAAINLHVSTQAPQTAYSTPRVVWRPDGSGMWVNGDDGVVRGVEKSSGKVVAMLRGGHEAGKKIRDLWAGWVEEEGGTRKEWVVSGGFDRRVVVWRVGEGVRADRG